MPVLENPKRERFCREYVIDLNATQAYIRAGYSENGAGQSAEKLLRNAEIQARIAELQAPIAQRLEITQESVLREIENTRIAATKAEQHSVALKAAELKGRHIGMWPQKSEVTVKRLGDLDDDQLDKLDRLLEMVSSGDSSDPGADKPRTH